MISKWNDNAMSNHNPLSFIAKLLIRPDISDANKARIIRLADCTSIKTHNASEVILESEASRTNRDNRHLPLELVDFLKKFSEIGSPLKYTTHPWDDNNNYESFDAFVEQYRTQLNSLPYWRYGGNGNNSKIATCNPKLFNIINSFLNKKEVDNYSWGKSRIKVGLLTKGVLASWLEKNPDKSFLDMPISEFKEEKIFAEGERIFVFGDIVDKFKNAIEYRNNNLFNTIRRATMSPDVSANKDKLETLKGVSFYTDTSLINEALQKIILNCKGRTDKTNLEIWAEEHTTDGNKHVDVHILHLNSFSDKNIEDPKLNLRSGNLQDIKNLLLGLCDFYIESRFIRNGESINARIEYLSYKDHSGKMKPLVTEIDDSLGFDYVLRFYLPEFK